jgi:spermidine/putrescine transport system permease protein
MTTRSSTYRAPTSALIGATILRVMIFGLPIAFVLVPILTFLSYSFWSMIDGRPVAQFTLENYARFFNEDTYYLLFLSTIRITAIVAGTAMICGYVVAYCIWRIKGRWKTLLLLICVLPLTISYIVKIYSLRQVLAYNGFLNDILLFLNILERPSRAFLFNEFAVTITMTMIYLPFGIFPIYLSMERIPRNLVAASADLGARPMQTFLRVVLPLTLPGTIVGGLFVMVLALGDFLTPQMVGGPNGFTFGRAIWSQFGLAFNWPFGAALAVMLLLLVGFILAISALILSRARVS